MWRKYIYIQNQMETSRDDSANNRRNIQEASCENSTVSDKWWITIVLHCYRCNGHIVCRNCCGCNKYCISLKHVWKLSAFGWRCVGAVLWLLHFPCHFRLYRKWCLRANLVLGKQLANSKGIYGMNQMLSSMWYWRRRLEKKRRAKEIILEPPGLKEEEKSRGDHSWATWPERFSVAKEI